MNQIVLSASNSTEATTASLHLDALDEVATFSTPVIGQPAVNSNQFVTKAQLDAATGGGESAKTYIEYLFGDNDELSGSYPLDESLGLNLLITGNLGYGSFLCSIFNEDANSYGDFIGIHTAQIFNSASSNFGTPHGSYNGIGGNDGNDIGDISVAGVHGANYVIEKWSTLVTMNYPNSIVRKWNVFIELNSVSNVSNGVASPLSDVTTITVKIQEIL
ncbi:hypothetical protein G5B00_09030 [Parapedobacter sp. SGR-10]|uniref:hypothetical protein n=1 Tax=Parapedobacter sp. SGR-10 TaxID=2710879 RepID=UPI0013D4A162|nr:hypothetical protein [Parapedobacter sp. SGR-10]NGF56659.1 hypothetical protein [Parapedobacter sp. SGR-10]